MYLDIIFCIKTFYRVAHLPATNPDDQAHCRLKPPHSPSISITSPAKNSPSTSLDSIVLGSISLVSTPPAVTCALGKLLVPRILNFQSVRLWIICSWSY